MTGRVTMRDVARVVGKSPMTVSRALRGDTTVSTATRDIVQKTAEDMGYVYDSTAHVFRTQKSGFVAVTVPSINNANFAETFRGLSEGLEGTPIQLLLGSTNYNVDKELELVQQLLTRNPQAIVLTGGHHLPQTCKLLKAAQIPVIETWDLAADPLGHVVGFSNADAMAKVVNHLQASGHRKLAFVGATAGTDMRGAARRDGVIAAAQALGLPPVEMIDAGHAPVSMRNGAQAIAELGQSITKFDALVCVSDPVAFGALSECRRLGIDVPNDLAVTGFGNFDLAMVSSPRITTVNVHANQIGRQIADVLKDIFNGQTKAQWIDVGSELVKGETG
jgi:LacI family gluconate utilization system Gnt-I transcriptional repressor